MNPTNILISYAKHMRITFTHPSIQSGAREATTENFLNPIEAFK